MANLEERIRQIVREETGQEAQPGGALEARLVEIEAQINDLKSDLLVLAGEQKPGQ